jgi:hypothetical protein
MEEMEKRSDRHIRDLVAHTAFKGLDANEIGCARIGVMRALSRIGAASMSDDLSAILLRDCGLKVRLSDFSDIVHSTKKPRTMPGLQLAGDQEDQ